MTKNNYIHKKPYMTPLILFEEIEQDEKGMVMHSPADVTGDGSEVTPGAGNEPGGRGGDGSEEEVKAASFIFENDVYDF